MSRPTAMRVAGIAWLVASAWACVARPTATSPSAEPPPSLPAPAQPWPDLPLEGVDPVNPIADPVPEAAASTDPPEIRPPVEAACALLPAGGDPIRAVALTDEVDPRHAPRPSNESERLLFRQLYDTLVTVDCEGRLRPGLAATWRRDPGGRSWIVTLDEAARFTDGRPVTTTEVMSSWGTPGSDGWLQPEVRRVVESVEAVSARVIRISLRDVDAESPRPLAEATLAIASRRPGLAWPLGTTAFRVIDHRRDASRNVRVVTIADDAGRGGGTGRVRFLIAPGVDPRDQLDEQVDLLVSRDPAVLAYAGTLPHFATLPMPWRRVHVLLSPARRRTSAPPNAVPPATRQMLATDAVRGEARGAKGPFWWDSASGCGLAARDVGTPAAPRREELLRRIVFEASDPVAGELGARLVALTTFDESDTTLLLDTLFPAGATDLVSAGLEGAAFEAALESGADSGYLVAVERRPFDPCQQARAMFDRVRWIDRSAQALGAVTVPLVDTRARAVVRRGRGGLVVDWDGGLVLTGVRETRP